MKKFSLKPVVFMFILTLVFTLVLSTLNHVTKDKIMLNELVKQQASFLYVLNFDASTLDAETINLLYNDHINEIKVNDFTLYEAYEDNRLIAYILPIEGKAVWGDLRALMALTPDFSEVIGIDILSHSETPGLGARIDDISFKEQFRGINLNRENDLNFIIYNPNPNGQVDAISGATGTSNALRRILNENLYNFFEHIKEGLKND
ncbi:FMN-binding protein [Serpentinicella alkaliphila]|uniref:Na+-transporting NADH:ubiquinone oxidoreductase subunit C n=1 Tax=Serpentinicella alkaliphila TaxID=1734049 RepID=A0A4R2TN59_9FIRM|nr:FMN-binding protein [Serpentinicella alkaliphila]QUH27083.1 FMN-binding protein [Serpentinicella alkaliphila]TCQ05210.1 Na+-transporting NADH:ubiquinone oxidoreductase subunit C [Serpentinicella alkaliphila]